MKNLMIAVLCLLILIVPWLIYDEYAGTTISKCTDIIDKTVLPAIEAEDWDTVDEGYSSILKYWDKFEKTSEYFLDTSAVNEADELINKTKYHIRMHDASNSAACSSELLHLLNYLHENEMVSFGNVF